MRYVGNVTRQPLCSNSRACFASFQGEASIVAQRSFPQLSCHPLPIFG